MANKKTVQSNSSASKNAKSSQPQGRTPSSRLDTDTGRYTVSESGAQKKNKPASKKTAAKTKRNKAPLMIFGLEINSDLLAKVAFIVVFAILISFLVRIENVETQTALKVTISKNIKTTGFAVRDETVVTTTKRGTFISTVENGSKVSKGESIVNVFASAEEAAAYRRVMEINDALEKFEQMKSADKDNATEINVLQRQLESGLLSFSKLIAGGDVSDACATGDDILYYLNKNQIATKVVENFSERIEELRKERTELISKYSLNPETVGATKSGYFIDTVDGYESLLGTEILEGLTPSKLEYITSQRVEPNNEGVVGKIADGYTWHLVCIVSSEEASLLNTGKSYSLSFPYSEAGTVNMKLISTQTEEGSDKVLLTFKCDNLVSELSTLRNQETVIKLQDITGIEINKDCLVTDTVTRTVSDSDAVGGSYTVTEEYLGVYILWGNEIKFKKVEIVYEYEDKVICAIKSDKSWLSIYDEVVLDTEDMYKGKIIR